MNDKQVHYSRVFYFPNGHEEIDLWFNFDDFIPEHALTTMELIIAEFDTAKEKIRRLKEQKMNDTMMKDPATRLEHLQYQKLKLEEATRQVSAEIIRLQEQMHDKEEEG